MVARRVRPPGRIERKGIESRGDRDVEFGKWVSATKHFEGAISHKAASGPVYDKPTYEEVAEHPCRRASEAVHIKGTGYCALIQATMASTTSAST
jgi:hypothetical protein